MCDERHDTIASCLPSIDHVARAGASFASASPCPATDADGDGLVDGFGLDTDCPWNVGWRDSGGEREVAGRFEAQLEEPILERCWQEGLSVEQLLCILHVRSEDDLRQLPRCPAIAEKPQVILGTDM